MPKKFQSAKSKLLEDLWLPMAKGGSELLFPQRKKHKKMRLFTLTDIEYQEIKTFEENQLTKREDVVVWTHSQLQGYRLDTELGRSKVICDGRFDDIANTSDDTFSENFPCQILNIDFLSQSPSINTKGRIEKELKSGKLLIDLLGSQGVKGLILFYTTIFDQPNLIIGDIPFTMPLPLDIQDPADDLNKKVGFVKSVLLSVVGVNNFSAKEVNHCVIDIENSSDKIFSVGITALRND